MSRIRLLTIITPTIQVRERTPTILTHTSAYTSHRVHNTWMGCRLWIMCVRATLILWAISGVSSAITHLSDLLKDMSGQVYTDLSEQEMLAFANFGRTLDSQSINRLTLGPGSGSQDFGQYASVYDPSAGSNQDVIIPKCANIQPAISRIFQSGFFGGCNVTTTG